MYLSLSVDWTLSFSSSSFRIYVINYRGWTYEFCSNLRLEMLLSLRPRLASGQGDVPVYPRDKTMETVFGKCN